MEPGDASTPNRTEAVDALSLHGTTLSLDSLIHNVSLSKFNHRRLFVVCRSRSAPLYGGGAAEGSSQLHPVAGWSAYRLRHSAFQRIWSEQKRRIAWRQP